MSGAFKKGDIVNANAVVTGGNGDRIFISVGEYSGLMVEPSILELISRPIKINDHVILLKASTTGTVRGISGKMAWIEVKGGTFITDHIKNLRLSQNLMEEPLKQIVRGFGRVVTYASEVEPSNAPSP